MRPDQFGFAFLLLLMTRRTLFRTKKTGVFQFDLFVSVHVNATIVVQNTRTTKVFIELYPEFEEFKLKLETLTKKNKKQFLTTFFWTFQNYVLLKCPHSLYQHNALCVLKSMFPTKQSSDLWMNEQWICLFMGPNSRGFQLVLKKKKKVCFKCNIFMFFSMCCQWDFVSVHIQ